MKKEINKPGKIALLTTMMIAFILCVTGCKDQQDPYEEVQVNPAFATNPPIATGINISMLEKPLNSGNLLYEATLPKEKIKSNVLALFVGDSNKIVLHDDGINGDKIAGDGIYSTVMNVDADSLLLSINNLAPQAQTLFKEAREFYQFNGRLALPADRKKVEAIREFVNKGTTDLKKSINLLALLDIRLLLPVSASFKHQALLITDPTVINDPTRTFNPCTNTGTAGGAWTFGKLMTDMANSSGISPENFVLNWLNTWHSTQTINSDAIASRNGINNIINTWRTLCGGPSAPLDVNKAPFKLLAIVNRFDLRSGGGYGGGNAGEGRFVFCATDANCQPMSIGFFSIFEFGVNKKSCQSIHNYAQQWIDLASLPFPSASYNNALQAITDQFAKAGTNPSKPNGSSLNQLRTNEFALGSLPWELREFRIDGTTHQLINVTTKREPQIPFNGAGAGSPTASMEAFGVFVNNNATDVINDKMDLPDNLTVSGSNNAFIAGKAHTQNPTNFHWDANETSGPGHITSDEARFHISLNTCSGCHGGEANTGNFTHIGLPLTATGEPSLSKFLTGDPAFSNTPFRVSDRANRPAGSPTQWPFNDLEKRGRDLIDFNSTSCISKVPLHATARMPFTIPIILTKQLTFNPNTMSH